MDPESDSEGLVKTSFCFADLSLGRFPLVSTLDDLELCGRAQQQTPG